MNGPTIRTVRSVDIPLGPGRHTLRLSLTLDGRGKPELILHERAKQLADEKGLRLWSISLTHTDTHAMGLAVALNLPSQTGVLVQTIEAGGPSRVGSSCRNPARIARPVTGRFRTR